MNKKSGFLLFQYLLFLPTIMNNSIKNITLRIRSIVTLLILAAQILTCINLTEINDILQKQNILRDSIVYSSDQLLTETFTSENSSRLKNFLPISEHKFMQIVGRSSKSAALFDYYLTYSFATKQRYSLHISQNHSLRSPPFLA